MDQEYRTTDEQIKAMREELRLAGHGKRGGSKPAPNASKTKSTNRYGKLAGSLLFIVAIVLLSTVLLSVLVTKSSGELPDLLGYQLFEIQSGSMEPTLSVGSIIVTKKPNHTTDLQVGDVVTFESLSGSIVTHRIIEVLEGENGSVAYRTKGDNPKNSPDQDLLTPDRVVAVMLIKIPLT